MTLPSTSTLCRIFTFFFAGTPLIYSPAPRGTCDSCCPIREVQDVKFFLYTNQNPKDPFQLYLSNDQLLQQSYLNKSHPLVMYLHGFSESSSGDEQQSSQQIKDAFLKAGNYNVILVDWSPLTAMPWYTNSVDNIPIAGRYIARFLRYLIGTGFPKAQIHVIGFSLGAEVAGFAGQQIQEWGVVLSRITGLDPALPLFNGQSSNQRLGPTDAHFVDVIHTDGGVLGNPEPLGHADFYPNNGVPLQPGCARQEIANNRWLNIIIGCSHQRAWQYFVESVGSVESFPSESCVNSTKQFDNVEFCRTDMKAFMGMGADKRLRGKFYLSTREESPFGKNAPRRT